MIKSLSPKPSSMKKESISHISKDFISAQSQPEFAPESDKKKLNKQITALHELGFSNHENDIGKQFSCRTPTLCVADLIGKHESFLKRAGF